MVGTPVIIQHQNVTKSNADKLRIGTISNAYFNEPDGWYYCEGIIWDDEAKDLIDKGWSVSCSYDFLAYNDDGGVENNIKYDKEFTQLNFTHLAIVDNPRYERANIVFNSKGEEKGTWITIKGNHIFIPDGKTLDEVIKEKGWDSKGESKSKNKQSDTKDKQSGTIYDITKDIDKLDEKISELDGERLVWTSRLREENKYKKGYSDVDKLKKTISDLESKINVAKGSREKLVKERDELLEKKYPNLKTSDTKGNKQEEPEWLKHERKKLDSQTTQMYEDRYSVEHPETYKKNLEEAKNKHGFKKDKDSGYYMKDLPDGTSVYVEKKEGGQGEKEPFYLEATHFDKDGKTIAKKQYHYDSMDGMFGKINKDFVSKDKKSNIKDNKTNNSKEKDMLLEELKKLIFKVENSKENDEMIDNEKVDKRKLIDEVAGIMKSAGCDDEDIRTAIGKMEKIGYDKSEDGSADNKKVKNEDEKKEDVDNKKVKNEEDDKKVDNEDAEDEKKVDELKKEEKEDVDNKCKNSKSSFDKINEIYNSIKQVSEEKTYVSRQEKLDNAIEYFK